MQRIQRRQSHRPTKLSHKGLSLNILILYKFKGSKVWMVNFWSLRCRIARKCLSLFRLITLLHLVTGTLCNMTLAFMCSGFLMLKRVGLNRYQKTLIFHVVFSPGIALRETD